MNTFLNPAKALTIRNLADGPILVSLDVDPILLALQQNVRRAENAKNSARNAFNASPEGETDYDPFSDEPMGPSFMAYMAAVQSVKEAKESLDAYHADLRGIVEEGA